MKLGRCIARVSRIFLNIINCRSRNVERDFERLFSLLVADRIKAVLPQPCLNFILSAESADPKLAYMCDKIVNMADVYHATHTYDGKPKVAGHENVGRFVSRTEAIGGNKGPGYGPNNNTNRVSSETQLKTPFTKSSPSSTSTNTATNLRCFNCNQLGHTRKLCPTRTQGNSS